MIRCSCTLHRAAVLPCGRQSYCSHTVSAVTLQSHRLPADSHTAVTLSACRQSHCSHTVSAVTLQSHLCLQKSHCSHIVCLQRVKLKSHRLPAEVTLQSHPLPEDSHTTITSPACRHSHCVTAVTLHSHLCLQTVTLSQRHSQPCKCPNVSNLISDNFNTVHTFITKKVYLL